MTGTGPNIPSDNVGLFDITPSKYEHRVVKNFFSSRLCKLNVFVLTRKITYVNKFLGLC